MVSNTSLTLYVLMDSSFSFDTLNLGQSIVHIKGCQVIGFKNDLFTFTKSVDPDEMPHNAAFYQDFHCL